MRATCQFWDETEFTVHVKSPVLKLGVDDSDCCYNCTTLLIRLMMERIEVQIIADTACKRYDIHNGSLYKLPSSVRVSRSTCDARAKCNAIRISRLVENSPALKFGKLFVSTKAKEIGRVVNRVLLQR